MAHKRWFLPLTFGLSAVVACSLTGPDIRVVATPVALPDPTSHPGEEEDPADTSATAVVAPVATSLPPGDWADVYAERTPNGLALHYADPSTGKELSAVPIESTRVMLAGEAIFFEGPDGGPVRASADGQHVPYAFIAPAEDADFFEFLISADGSTLVWLEMRHDEDSNPTIIWAAWDDRDAILPIYEFDAPPDGGLRLVSLSEDGGTLYVDARMDLLALDVNSGEATELPTEPGCGDAFFCEAVISDDGRYLLRAKSPPGPEPEPIVVHDIASGRVVARFAAQPTDEMVVYEVSHPILAPDRRRLVYRLAEGPFGEEAYSYFLADTVTGEQSLLAESGTTPLRPVRWLDRQTLVLSAEPSAFDEWHLDTTTGELKRVSDRLYLGRVTLP